MYRRLPLMALGASMAMLLPACTNIRVVHDSDPEADFAGYRTWAWITEEPLIGPKAGEVPVSYVSPLDEKRIRRAVETTLSAKGYLKENAEESDLIVSFTIGTQEKTKVYSTPSAGYYDDYGYGGWYGGSDVRIRRYTEGTLSVQFYDRRSKNAVWVGWGSKRVSKSDDSEKVIKEAVTKILEAFPSHL